MTTETTPERAMLEKFLAWNKRWPKSSAMLAPYLIKQMELELDDIMTEAEELFK